MKVVIHRGDITSAVVALCTAHGEDPAEVCQRVLRALGWSADAGMPCGKAAKKYALLYLADVATGEPLGLVGSETKFKDSVGPKLRVGDLVTVDEVDGKPLPGLYLVHHKANNLFHHGRKTKKVKDFREVELGETHGGIQVAAVGSHG